MMERCVNRLVNQMEKEALLKPEMREHYIYTLIVIGEKWITVLSILFLSILFKQFITTVLFLVCFMPLRKRTGGFHADKFWKCYFGTLAIYIVIICICPILAYHMNIIYMLLVVSIFLIGVMGTINHPNMEMDCYELHKSKQSARYILGLESIIILMMITLKMREIYLCYMSISIILCAILMCIAKKIGQEVNCIENK